MALDDGLVLGLRSRLPILLGLDALLEGIHLLVESVDGLGEGGDHLAALFGLPPGLEFLQGGVELAVLLLLGLEGVQPAEHLLLVGAQLVADVHQLLVLRLLGCTHILLYTVIQLI